MRIAIITFHRAINYGAVLQAYALGKHIQGRGGNVKIVDYNAEFYRKYSLFHNIKNIRAVLGECMRIPIVTKKKKKFRNFIRKNMQLTMEMSGKSDYWNLIEKDFDLFISGSDQVWNYEYIGLDGKYFLDFVKDSQKKNSYAASFGFGSLPMHEKWYKDKLADFNNISVRERSASDIITKLLPQRKIVDVVVDPTMLVPRKEWQKLETKPRAARGKYVLLYIFGEQRELIEFAIDIAKSEKADIVYVCDGIFKNIDATYARGIGPEEWLYLVNHAEAVVTNSYHGLVFSLIFNKSLFIGLNPPPDNTNSRMLEAMKNYGLEDRIIEKNGRWISKEIDYLSINNKICEDVRRSKKYLDDMLNSRQNI